MVFSSILFIFIFLPALMVLYLLVPKGAGTHAVGLRYVMEKAEP